MLFTMHVVAFAPDFPLISTDPPCNSTHFSGEHPAGAALRGLLCFPNGQRARGLPSAGNPGPRPRLGRGLPEELPPRQGGRALYGHGAAVHAAGPALGRA